MGRLMEPLASLATADLAAFHARVQERYTAFQQRGLSLDLTRGKPSARSSTCRAALLALPGPSGRTGPPTAPTCRNYGGLQGLPELRRSVRARSRGRRRSSSSSATTPAWR